MIDFDGSLQTSQESIGMIQTRENTAKTIVRCESKTQEHFIPPASSLALPTPFTQ